MELLTAVEYEVPVVWIVENNNMHGITWHGSRQLGSRKGLPSVRYKRPLHVAEIARAMGLHAQVVERPGAMQEAVRAALREPGPSVIEVLVDASVVPPLGDRVQTISGFVER
jgi:acetolactate synthase-1/2/3 large subunit